MNGNRYKIIFGGKTLEDQDIESVKKKIAGIFKLDKSKIEPLFSSKPLVIRKNIDFETALEYANSLQNSGAACEIRKMTPEDTAEKESGPETMICPKCERKQPKDDTCRHCGILIEKYKPRNQNPQMTHSNSKNKFIPVEIEVPPLPDFKESLERYAKAAKFRLYILLVGFAIASLLRTVWALGPIFLSSIGNVYTLH